MDVIYYTQPCYLDAALETIKSIKNVVGLHVFIEIAPESKCSNIINVNDLDNFNIIEPFENVVGKEEAKYFSEYFNGVASVQFVVHKHKKSFSLQTFWVSYIFNCFIRHIQANVVHFDSITARSISLLPFMHKFKKYITIHDPIPHIGEHSWKKTLTQKVFNSISNGYFFYSKYARKQFENNYSLQSKSMFDIRLQPYTFNKQFIDQEGNSSNAILFFGRLSFYKGVDLLIEAIPLVLKFFPNQQFILAGKSDGYAIDNAIVQMYPNNITVRNEYLTPTKLVNLVSKSMFVVCPYRDATQSGVLMTAKALGKIVVATKIGAFPEYINDGVDGILIEPTAYSIAQSILQILNNNAFPQMEQNVDPNFSEHISLLNQHFILNAYSFVD